MAASEQVAVPAQQSPQRRWLKPFLFYILPILIALVVVGAVSLSSYRVLPRLRASPGFTLVDQNGQTVTSEDMRGSIVLYSIASTNCDGPCQESLNVLNAARDRLAQLGALDSDDDVEVKFVTLFTDPNRDTPENLRAFAESQGAGDGLDWFLLTGDESSVKAVLHSGFGLPVRASSGFPPAFFVVDEAGFVRAEYTGKMPQGRNIADTVGLVVDEARAEGFGAAAYGAAHKFNFTCNAR